MTARVSATINPTAPARMSLWTCGAPGPCRCEVTPVSGSPSACDDAPDSACAPLDALGERSSSLETSNSASFAASSSRMPAISADLQPLCDAPITGQFLRRGYSIADNSLEDDWRCGML